MFKSLCLYACILVDESHGGVLSRDGVGLKKVCTNFYRDERVIFAEFANRLHLTNFPDPDDRDVDGLVEIGMGQKV